MATPWLVALLSPPYSTLTYLAASGPPPGSWTPGQRVLAPLGRNASLRMGVLWAPAQGELAAPRGTELRELVWPVDRVPLLSPAYLEMVDHLARRQMLTPGRVLGNHLPAGLRSTAVAFLLFDQARPRGVTPAALARMGAEERWRLGELWADGRMEVKETARAARPQVFCSVAKDPPWPVRPAAKRQTQVLEYLWESGPVPRNRLAGDLGPWAPPVADRLADLGLVCIAPRPEDTGQADACPLPVAGPGGRPFDLTPEQRAALEPLALALASDEPGAALVYGVTGSGKTALYLELAQRCLEAGRHVLLLAPEVALAAALHRAARDWFPTRAVRLYHGYQSPAARQRAFLEAARATEPMVVAGTRSALFLPLDRPGLVVLDEEHDSSFKQEERLNYQAKEIAHFLAAQSKGLLVLGSATPDVKTFHAARQGLIPLVRLEKRVNEAPMPAVELADIRELKATEHLLAPATVERLARTVKAGDQAIILLNRRGYAPLMYCTECGRTAQCPQCEIGLTFHKARERLVCHYCGHAEPFPLVCGDCGGSTWLPMGEGTEKVEETLAAALPRDVGVLRLDRDSTRRPGRMEEILDAFAAGKAQVLVGTQMLAKGHHFPDVTLVVVADGDLGLNLPDYRAPERTFQLLVQVSGRAGRGAKPGSVLIQTRDPSHYCWQYVRAGDYEGFFEQELAKRAKRRYPPFARLALVRMSFPVGFDQGMQRVTELAALVRRAGQEQGVTVLGPAPAPLAVLRGRKRYHCLLKGDDWQAMRAVYGRVAQGLPSSSQLRLSLDLDPISML